ncbi:MAG TPA: adenylate/guanylate cyclase domain-containing protein [Roseiarcus sp.]|nr:adenylate/guanylate cyclase domain-containing protein [Roseiarcus sp.]
MKRDEAKTFQRVKAHRNELIEPAITEHRGCIFKLMGDGLLAEFGSVVDAVECAVDIQRGMAERNAGEPQDQRIDIRIGINLGEVIWRALIGMPTVSTSRPVSSNLPTRAASAFPARWRRRLKRNSRSASSRWGSRRSRTSASPSRSIG